MMNAPLNILLIEVALVLLIAVCFLLFLAWKQKKRRADEFEQLLENVDSQQDERKAQLVQLLAESYGLKASEAKESGEYMVEAEKQFLQQFIKQQIEQTTVTDFYQNLCELLDQYMYFIPKMSAEQKGSENGKSAKDDVENKKVELDEEDDLL